MGDSSFEQTDMHRKTNSGNIVLIVFYLSPICYFFEPKRPSHLPIIIIIIIFFYFFFFFFAEIKDSIGGECPSTKIAALDIENLVFLVYHPPCMYK